MWINGVGGDQFTGAVHYGDLHAGTQTRIETHSRAQASRRRHQQIVEVAGKDVNGFIFRAFTHGAHQFGFEMHQDFDAPCPAHHAFAPAIRRGVVQTQAEVILDDLLAVALFGRLIELRVGIKRQLQHAFVAATEHRQRTV